MSKKKDTGDKITANITGDISGQVAVGKNISQVQRITKSTEVTKEELNELQELFSSLRKEVVEQAAPDKKDSALERVEELEQAVISEKPDISTMEYVQNWFTKNLPSIAGGVTSIVINPIVGKLVEAGGDALINEFKRRFGSTPS